MPLFTLHTLSRSAILATGIVLAACSPGKQPQAPVTGTGDESAQTAAAADGATPPADRQAYFGALHVHTSLSFDAFTNGTRTMPEDAFRCFMGTDIEVLAVGNCYLRKEEQDPSLKRSYENQFELD